MSNRIPLATPTMHGDEQRFVQEAFDTNWVAPLGKNVDEFEKEISQYVGAPHAVALSACTAALHLAVKLAGVKPGDKVFCSDFTFAATVNPISYEKGEQVFIDSERDTWNMDPKALEAAFKKYPNCKCVIVANLYGTPAKLDELRAICDKHGAVMIEDAAESLGATYHGKQTGTFGHYNTLSFNGNKIITSSGGGMLLSNNKSDISKARKWATQSRDSAPWYQHSELGYNYRMSNVVAGIGRGQLQHLNEHIALKKAIFERYKEGFKGLPVMMNPYIADEMEPNFWLSCLLIDHEAMCKQKRTKSDAWYVKEAGKTCPTEILEKIARNNIEGRPIWKPMHLQPIFSKCDFIAAGDNVGEDIFTRGLCLPSDIKMTPAEQDIVIDIVRRCFEG